LDPKSATEPRHAATPITSAVGLETRKETGSMTAPPTITSFATKLARAISFVPKGFDLGFEIRDVLWFVQHHLSPAF
jgi:hypothetical protein